MSNIAIVKIVLKPKLDMRPGIFALETDLTKDWQITLLSSLITLTPGTLVIDMYQKTIKPCLSMLWIWER